MRLLIKLGFASLFSVLLVASVKQSTAVIENKKKYLPGYKFLIDDKAIFKYMVAKLSREGTSAETVRQLANDEGVNGLNALLSPFTPKKTAAVLYPKLCK